MRRNRMETLSQCKPSILPSLRRKHQPSQVLAVMHLLLCPLQQERASSISLKTHCLNNSVSNTDTGSIKQASNQTKSMSNPPKQCSVPSAEDPKKETFPTDCGNPLEQSSNTRPAEHKAFAAGSKRWSTSETSIRSVRPEPRAGNSIRLLAHGVTYPPGFYSAYVKWEKKEVHQK
jgi:hypothetical protein